MADLSKDIQIFIVQQLACFRKPFQIIEDVKEQFDSLIVEKQQVYYYQKQLENKKPNNWTKELQKIFKDSRKKFLKELGSIAISNSAYRLQIYDDLVNRELKKNDASRNDIKILQITEQAAKDVGGMFTNRRELTGAGGKDLIPAEQMAMVLFKKLLDEGFTREDAADFSAKNYQVNKEKIINSDD